MPGTTHRNPPTPSEDRHITVAGIRLQADEGGKVHQPAAMDAGKLSRIEGGFQARQGLLFQVSLAGRMERNIVILGLECEDIRDRHEADLRTVTNDETPQGVLPPMSGKVQGGGRGLRPIGAKALARPRNGLPKALEREGLEEVIHGMDLEGTQGEMVIGGSEDHRRSRFEKLQNFKTVQLGHLDVEKKQIRTEIRAGFDCGEAIGKFAHDLQIGLAGAVFAQELARQFFIVDDQGAHRSD